MKLEETLRTGHALGEYLLRRNRVRTVPLQVSLELTNVCNFRCKYCPQSDPHHHDRIKRTHLTVEQAQAILGGVRRMGFRRDLIHWTLDGEPFLNRSFHDIFRLGAELGFTNQFFATNGVFLTEDNVKRLPNGIHYTFTIDFCADEEQFETRRGTRGSWKTIISNIKRILVNANGLDINFLITDITPFDVREPKEINRRHHELCTLFPRSARLKISRKTFHNATGFGQAAKGTSRYHVCPYPWTSMSIASNGDVVACCRDLEHKTILGNALHESVDAIWNGPQAQALRQSLAEGRPEAMQACKECDMPYDPSKFSMANLLRTAAHSLQFKLFDRTSNPA